MIGQERHWRGEPRQRDCGRDKQRWRDEPRRRDEQRERWSDERRRGERYDDLYTETSASATGTIGATIGTTIPGATMTGATAGGGEGQPQHSERR